MQQVVNDTNLRKALTSTCKRDASAAPSAKVVEADPRPRNAHYMAFLTVTVGAYVAIYASLLISTEGFPYVTDNNESFSSLWHAHNLCSYDFFASWGLTDEAFSRAPEAHPFVHTHQGNFPRLFAVLIYIIGATTISTQIVTTTFTIGLLTIWMAYHFFARRASPAAAFCVSLFLMTDYVYFMQWQVVTYRVWHGFFVFSSLLCVAYAQTGQRAWKIATFLNFLGLYYFEITFVIFITTVCILFALSSYWGQGRTVRRLALVAGLGAIVSVSIFFAQLLAYMGPRDTANDIYYTVKARQYTDPNTPEAERVIDFYKSRKIAFFDNFGSGLDVLSPRFLIAASAHFHLSPYTPVVVMPLFLIIGAVALRRLLDTTSSPPTARADAGVADSLATKVLGFAYAAGVIASCTMVFQRVLKVLLSAREQEGGAGVALRNTELILVASLFAIAAFYLSKRCFPAPETTHGRWRTLAAVFLLMAGACAAHKGAAGLGPISQELLANPLFQVVVLAGLVSTVAQALAIVNGWAATGKADRAGRFVSSHLGILACATVGYLLATVLLGSYVFSGYLQRWLSFLSFLLNPLLGLGIYFLCTRLRGEVGVAPDVVQDRTRREVGGSVVPATVVPRWPAVSRAVLIAVSISFLVLTWVRLQFIFVEYLPADHLSGLKRHSESKYTKHSVICNSYAAPAAWFMGSWGFSDPAFSLQTSAFEGRELGGKYCWLADAQTNQHYRRPDYYLIVWHQSVGDVCSRILQKKGGSTAHGLDELTQLTRFATPQTKARAELVAYEIDPYPRWALMKLNWD